MKKLILLPLLLNVMKKIFLILFLSFFILSCNNVTENNKDEANLNQINLRIQKVNTLSESFKNNDNEFLKTLLDSLKIIKNDINQIKISNKSSDSLYNKLNETTSAIKRLYSFNCIKNRNFTHTLLKGIKYLSTTCDLLINVEMSNKNIPKIIFGQKFDNLYNTETSSRYIDNSYMGDIYVLHLTREIKNENIKMLLKNRLNLNPTIDYINDTCFKINLKNYPIYLKIDNLKECECTLTNKIVD